MKHSLKWRFAASAMAIAALVLAIFPVAPAAAGYDEWSSYGCYYGYTGMPMPTPYGSTGYQYTTPYMYPYHPNYMYPYHPCYSYPYHPSYMYPYHPSSMYPYQPYYPSHCVTAYHPVQFGETLSGIALQYGVSVSTLAYYNGIANPHLIYAGTTLVIPCSTGYPSQPYPMQPIYPPQPYPSPYATPMPMATPPTSGQALVAMRNIAFNPATLTIHVGQTVMWRNDDGVPHTTTSGSCPGGVCTPMPGWDSGTLNPGQSFSHQFTTTGTFTYFCRIHGAMMQGSIVVMP